MEETGCHLRCLNDPCGYENGEGEGGTHAHTFSNGKSLQNETLKVRNQVQERSRASVGEILEVCVIGWSGH